MRKNKSFLLALIFSIVVGAALGFSPPANAYCDRLNYDCPQSGRVVSNYCLDQSCYGRCTECFSKGCSSSGCCYHEWIECPDWGGEWDESVICGGACLRTFDWE